MLEQALEGRRRRRFNGRRLQVGRLVASRLRRVLASLNEGRHQSVSRDGLHLRSFARPQKVRQLEHCVKGRRQHADGAVQHLSTEGEGLAEVGDAGRLLGGLSLLGDLRVRTSDGLRLDQLNRLRLVQSAFWFK